MPSLLYKYLTLSCLALLVFSAPAHAVDDSASDDTPPPPVSGSSGGAGDLLVAPTRVVLEGRTRAAQVILNNTGSKEATYRISLVHLHMDESGKYQDATAATGDKPADELFRYSPRQVTLKPGESQIVKIMARKPEQLAPGEYRSHMVFRAVPESAGGEDIEAKPTAPGQISIRLIPVYGVSIPIIVREGDLTATAGITGAARTNGSLSLTLTRSGSKSLYGDIIVSQSDKVVGEMRGVSVLVPNQKRRVTVPLDKNAESGPLTIEYLARDNDTTTPLAKTTLTP